ncbi:MAG: NAD(P)-dependent oxidoreductase [Novosphingobium sp.]|nr:NAD(P)-dependent oxidoreductase [Novosphingobium sp.]
MSTIRTGFIGLGSQGAPMARRMMEGGFPLTVWARRAEVMGEWASMGAGTAASPAQLAENCDHIGVCVVNDADVAEICDQLIPAMREGSLLAIHSTILPESCEKLEARCAGRGIRFIDAPVSGGEPAASAGVLTVMCGGSEEAFQAARPVFETFGKLIVLLGPAGSGQRAKIVNNALMAANFGLSHAAVQAAQALAIDRAAFAELISASSGRSYAFEIYARLPAPAAFAMGAALLDKDVNLLARTLEGDENTELLKRAAAYFLGPALAG